MVKNKGIIWNEYISNREHSNIAPGNTDVVDFENIENLSSYIGSLASDGQRVKFGKCVLHGSGYINATIGTPITKPRMKIYVVVTPSAATVTNGNYARGSVTSIIDNAINTVYSFQHLKSLDFGTPIANNATVNNWTWPIKFNIDLTKWANVIASKISEEPDVDLKVSIMAIYLDDSKSTMTGLLDCHLESKLILEQRKFGMK